MELFLRHLRGHITARETHSNIYSQLPTPVAAQVRSSWFAQCVIPRSVAWALTFPLAFRGSIA
jgi:hypothetical protein